MSATVQHIPEVLIYEKIKGSPIYYREYKEVLNGTKQLEEVIGSRYLQSMIITRLVLSLGKLLDNNTYEILSNEVGIQLDKNAWRSADIAICKQLALQQMPLKNKYLQIAPDIVIEIDTKAHLHDIENPFGYYHEKTDQLLQFGVQKVFWIFTETKKIMIAEKNRDWITVDWEREIEVASGASFNIVAIIS